jgi:hypothetical protein
MKIDISKATLGIVFAGLVIASASVQVDLKEKPQIFMLAFSSVTLVSFFIRPTILCTLLFYILLSFLFYIAYFLLLTFLIDLFSTTPKWEVYNGIRRPIKNMNWVWGAIAALFLSPISVVIHHKQKMRIRAFEIATTSFFIAMTAVIYITFELL